MLHHFKVDYFHKTKTAQENIRSFSLYEIFYYQRDLESTREKLNEIVDLAKSFQGVPMKVTGGYCYDRGHTTQEVVFDRVGIESQKYFDYGDSDEEAIFIVGERKWTDREAEFFAKEKEKDQRAEKALFNKLLKKYGKKE
jgi:hypothetical protein